ncbi:hypothetical protein ACTXT7_011277 [Hymenolepis weldensis]
MAPPVLILIDSPPVYTLPPLPCSKAEKKELKSNVKSNGEEGTTVAGFNIVRKKQLERLNYRSNWFLSPPSGLRQAGLMRVDPLSPGLLPYDSRVEMIFASVLPGTPFVASDSFSSHKHSKLQSSYNHESHTMFTNDCYSNM